MRIYIASALSESAAARNWAVRISNERGLSIGSRWHDYDAVGDPVSKDVRRAVFESNISDLRGCDALLLQTVTGAPSCAYVELGYALALGLPCVWLQPAGRRADGVRFSNISDASHSVMVVNHDADVIPELLRLDMAMRDTLTELEGAA